MSGNFPQNSSVFFSTNLPLEILKFCNLSEAMYNKATISHYFSKLNLMQQNVVHLIDWSVQYLESQYMIDYPATTESNHV